MAMKTNQQRLWDSLMAMAQIGATEKGGSCRLALTPQDKAGRDLFAEWCREAGCQLKVDNMGNMFLTRPGQSTDAAPVAMGSHLDTQPHGGKFDGVYGVLAGLEVMRTLNDNNIQTRAPVEVIVWTNEEGSRFAPAMLASAVFAGVFDLAYGWSRTDNDGVTVKEALEAIGYNGEAACGDHPLGAFFEAHIEQGPILEREEKTIGVVGGAQGSRWYDVTVTGMDAHAGSTPMIGRKDALVSAAQIVTGLQTMALDNGPDAVATVGQMSVIPNSRNTIPGRVEFSVDIRHQDAETLERLDEAFRSLCAGVERSPGISIDIDPIWYQPPVAFDPDCVSVGRRGGE